MTILFRSLRAKHIRRGESRELLRLSGGDWNSLRNYTNNDDARNIVWKKSTNKEQIYTKERLDTGSFSIQLLIHETMGDDFLCLDFPISRSAFFDKAKSVLKLSAHAGGHGYRELANVGELQKIEPKSTLIFVLSSTLDSELHDTLKIISPYNDVIFLHVLHPVEIQGNDDLLFSGKILKNSYKKSFEQKRKEVEKSLTKLHASYIKIETLEDIEKRLNYFFKTRFQHG